MRSPKQCGTPATMLMNVKRFTHRSHIPCVGTHCNAEPFLRHLCQPAAARSRGQLEECITNACLVSSRQGTKAVRLGGLQGGKSKVWRYALDFAFHVTPFSMHIYAIPMQKICNSQREVFLFCIAAASAGPGKNALPQSCLQEHKFS
jgi:hypothetical protein